MNNDERIIKYLDNDLSPDERTMFEEELRSSVELRKIFEKYLRVRRETEHLKNLKLDQSYLNSSLAEFHSRIDTNKSFPLRKSLAYAFGLTMLFIISVAIIKTFFNAQIEIEDFTKSLDENQKMELLEIINGETGVYNLISENFSEDDLVSIIESDLQVDNEIAETYNIELDELVLCLNAEEADVIYQKIINANLLEEDAL